MYRFIPAVIILSPHDSNVAVTLSLLPVLRVKFHVTLRSLIGLFNWIIKCDKSGRQAKTIRNVAGRNFTRGFAAAKNDGCSAARPLTNPASYAGYFWNYS